MAVEIERKFMVQGESWRQGATGTFYRQGYLHHDPESTVRIRVAGEKALITIKGASVGASRLEFEYSIPKEDAEAMLSILCKKPIIEKIRYKVSVNGMEWDVDEFLGENTGLVIAEIELESEKENFTKPIWTGMEVTGQKRYYNANLLSRPYKDWTEQEKNPTADI